jgi:hypothetical protein
MMAEASAMARWRFVAGCVLLAVLGFFPFVRGTRVPLLGWIDLALHEFGHLATGMLPDVVTAMMGNGAQTAVPLALAAVFCLRERDWLATMVCLGWAAATLQDASLYIGDAPYQRLELIGGYHDWAFALGTLGWLDAADALARLIWAAGFMLWLMAMTGMAAGPWIEPVLRARGLRGAIVHFLFGEPAVPQDPTQPSPPATVAPDAWDDFYYGSTPDRASAKRTNLS